MKIHTKGKRAPLSTGNIGAFEYTEYITENFLMLSFTKDNNNSWIVVPEGPSRKTRKSTKYVRKNWAGLKDIDGPIKFGDWLEYNYYPDPLKGFTYFQQIIKQVASTLSINKNWHYDKEKMLGWADNRNSLKKIVDVLDDKGMATRIPHAYVKLLTEIRAYISLGLELLPREGEDIYGYDILVANRILSDKNSKKKNKKGEKILEVVKPK